MVCVTFYSKEQTSLYQLCPQHEQSLIFDFARTLRKRMV